MSHTKRYVSSKDYMARVIKQHKDRAPTSHHLNSLSVMKAYDQVKADCAKAQRTATTNYSVSESTQYNTTPMNSKVKGKETRKRSATSTVPSMRQGTLSHY